jgi:hypothetical protein
MEDKFEAWMEEVSEKPVRAQKSVQRPVRVSSVQNRTSKQEDEDAACAMIKSEIARIDCEIVANGGINCGWEAADHEDFLKVRTKMSKLTVAFITAMRRAVPTADEMEVRAHFDAYTHYVKLVDDKKDLIAKYKQAKDLIKQKKLKQQESMDRLNADLNFGKSLHRERTGSLGIEDKIKRREQLREW